VRSAPFQRTIEPETKLLPVAVRVKPGPPAAALAGASAHSAPHSPAVAPTPEPVTPAQTAPAEVAPNKPLTPVKPKPAIKKQAKPPVRQSEPPPKRQERENRQAPAKQRPTPTATTARPAHSASKAGQQGSQGSRQSDNKQRESGHAQQAGGQALSDQYDMAVRRHLLSRKQTPKTLSRRQKGTVEVEFVINRQGELVRQDIGKPSRIREFDRAARQLVASAAPYPQPPAELEWQTRRYRIAIHYQSH